MNSTKTSSQELIEQLEILPWTEDNQEEFQNLIQLLKRAIHQDKTNFVALEQNMSDGVAHCEILCDSEGIPCDYKFISTNKAFETHSGVKASKVLSKTISQIFPSPDKFFTDFYGKVALTQVANSITRYSPNAEKHFFVKAYSLTKGKFTMLFKDVTESVKLKAAKLELEKSHNQKSAVLANMQEAFSHCQIICDDKNNPIDYRFLYVNAAFESQTGVKAKNAVGKTILELFPDIEKSWITIYGKVAQTSKPNSFIKFNHNTNKYFQVNAFSPAAGEFAVLFRDVTSKETKRLELEKIYAKAEENDKLKSAFLANMSHEVRTPMNAILGFSGLLEDDAVSEEDKKICLQQIKSSGNQLLTIISDIVDISKIDANQQKLIFNDCDLNQLIDDLFNRYSVLNRNSKIRFKIEKGYKAGAFEIKTDETRLNQILSNLIENALKYTLKGEVILGYTIEGDYLQFYVKDTGIGIKKANQKMIFKRFAQVENEAGTISSGTGLGIPIAKGLIKLFEGTMWLVSKPNKGSTFYFKIPNKTKTIRVPNKVHKQTILIAEDDDVNFLLLNLWLNTHFNVLRAVNGFEAVHLFEKKDTIDLILMDIRMPFMNGIEATKQIRKSDMYIPIIAHTAYAMNEESIMIKKAGCNLVLIKPITRDRLFEVLAEFKVVI